VKHFLVPPLAAVYLFSLSSFSCFFLLCSACSIANFHDRIRRIERVAGIKRGVIADDPAIKKPRFIVIAERGEGEERRSRAPERLTLKNSGLAFGGKHQDTEKIPERFQPANRP